MKYILILFCFFLCNCGTVGGAISGVGEDIKKVGDIIKSD